MAWMGKRLPKRHRFTWAMTSAVMAAIVIIYAAFVPLDVTRASASISISPSSTSVEDDGSYSITVTATGLSAGDYISLSASGKVAFNSSCTSRTRYFYYSPVSTTVYACATGSGKVKAGLYQVDDKEETRVATATHTVTVTEPPPPPPTTPPPTTPPPTTPPPTTPPPTTPPPTTPPPTTPPPTTPPPTSPPPTTPPPTTPPPTSPPPVTPPALTLPDPADRTFTGGAAITAFYLPAATGGTTPYTYSVTGLPAGLTFTASSLRVSGTPTTVGAYTVTYTVTDSATPTASSRSQSFSITISPGRVATPTVIQSNAALLVSWTAPSQGRSSITGYQVQNKQTSHSSWPATSQAVSVTAARVSGLTNGVPYDVRVRACAAAGVCGDWSTPAGGVPQPAPTVSNASPFVSQSVTLTAPAMSTQTAASYQWQAWSQGAWVNRGSASASSTLSASYSSAQAWAYRVVVTYGTGAAATTATSSAVLVEWKPVVIDVTSNNPFPVTTGDAGDRMVTLTAGGDIPSGATYQWQEWSGTAWTNLGTASTTATKDVSSTSSTTKKYQVVVTYASSSSSTAASLQATSRAVHVTWDLGATLREITNALSASIPAPTSSGDSGASGQAPALTPQQRTYVTAETALLSCVSGAPATSGGGVTYASFAALMTQYTGSTKTLLDSGACSTKATTAWTAVTAVFSSTFTTISTTGTNATAINAFLSSAPGQSFKAYMLSRTSLTGSIEDFIVPTAAIFAIEPTGTTPGAGGQQGENEDRDDDYVGICLKFAGIGANDNANEAPLAKRLATLNCLAFRTAHSYWLGLANNSGLEAYKTAVNGVDWLSYGDLECSIPVRFLGLRATWLGRLFVDFGDSAAEKAACFKHDLSWGSLQAMAGNTMLSESDDDNELDRAHNPRNKFLADFTFYVENVCESETNAARRTCLSSPDRLTEVLASIWSLPLSADFRRFWGVAEWTDRGWPITQEDVDRAYETRMYADCNPPIPSATGLRLSLHGYDVRAATIRVDHQIVSNCTRVQIGHIEMCLSSSDCTKVSAGGLSSWPRFRAGVPDELHIASIRLYPANGLYGGQYYTVEINRTIQIE